MPPRYLVPMTAPASVSTPDRRTVHQWQHHWQDEYDAAYLYVALAAEEPDPGKQEIYRQLAVVERRHTEMWEKLLADNGHPVPLQVKPSVKALIIGCLGPRFVSHYLLMLH